MHTHLDYENETLVVHIDPSEIEPHAVSLALLEAMVAGVITEAQSMEIVGRVDTLMKQLYKNERVLTDAGDGLQMVTEVLTTPEAQGDEQ